MYDALGGNGAAAGNDARNACDHSPGSAANTTTVAASTITDARAPYSNYGSCVDLYAPGSSVTSTWLNGGTNTISGTSMATPHATGVAALYKAANGDASYGVIRSWLTSNAAEARADGCDSLPVGIGAAEPYSERGSCNCGSQGRFAGAGRSRSGGRACRVSQRTIFSRSSSTGRSTSPCTPPSRRAA
ncbi:S8 family serine peptidase [Actinomadura citrea]|uniref:S8 family serine peptidase n=1 Tax=Actinomadura citrea TaxID=46158 RepID=UPI003CE5AA64